MTATSPATVPSMVRSLRPARVGIMGQKVIINIFILAAIWIVLSILTPRFLTVENFSNVLRQIAVVATVGSVVTLVMVSRNFDLSVGGSVALSAAVVTTLIDGGSPVPVAILAGILTGFIIGNANGFLILAVGINSVVTTLGMMYLTQGSALLVTHGVPIYSMPESYRAIGAGYLGPVPIPVIIMLLAVLIMTFVERRTLLGRWTRATGSNPDAARLSGVPTRRVQWTLFALAGAVAGWGGIMISSRAGGFFATVGEGFEFQVIVAAVLGGTSLMGGEGLVFGTLLGALIVGSLNNGMNILGIPTFWQTAVLGATLVLAVVLDAMLRRRARRVAMRVTRIQTADQALPQAGGSEP